MGKYHQVAQGECFSSLAHKFGFETYRAIAEATENEALKKERANPNVLKPGDVVYIPDVELKEVDAATEQTHVFVLKREKTMFRLIVRGEDETPFADTRYELRVDEKIYEGRSDDAGKIEREISAKARSGQLVIYPKDDDGNEIVGVIPLEFGDLDPVTEPSGVLSRLNNLGFLTSLSAESKNHLKKALPTPPSGGLLSGDLESLTSLSAETGERLKEALLSFQKKHGLAESGECCAATAEKLRQMHDWQ